MQPQEKKEAHFITRIPKYYPVDYNQWQQSKKKPRLNLPQIKVASGNWMSRRKASPRPEFTRTKFTTKEAAVSNAVKNQQQKIIGNEMDLEKIQADIRILRAMLKFRRASLDELKKHVTSLTISNQQLAKKIQDIEAVTAEKVRKLLQQQDMFGTVIGTLEDANHKQMQEMKSKLEKWSAQAKVKVNDLEQQLTKVKTNIRKAQDELNFLTTYMDQEYPVKSVQIADLMRQIQEMKNSNEDELEELQEICKDVLQTLSKKLMVKTEKILYVMAKRTILPYQAALMRKTLSNQRLLKQIVQFRVHIDRMKKELPRLKGQVRDLQMQRKDPREVVFASVLLRKPNTGTSASPWHNQVQNQSLWCPLSDGQGRSSRKLTSVICLRLLSKASVS
ncbi:uncharacterized protein C20orf96-like [Vombatus ursinus]|uniref:uncharacterized protein C20orf96-like n=1 Tax=Vombatus ursinus TaxID=29139 RepID=UPI000FFD4C33|nr:uncharacterized protein C20orf96-like [Vombatus ursinus]